MPRGRCLQVRVEAIRTVGSLAHVGGHEMVLQMVAWQDPNAIAIKAFYEPDLHVNFCGKLATDPVVQVTGCQLMTFPESVCQCITSCHCWLAYTCVLVMCWIWHCMVMESNGTLCSRSAYCVPS